jgi:hypothetical protein
MLSGDVERLRWVATFIFVINAENDIIDTTPVETGIVLAVKIHKKNSGLKRDRSSLSTVIIIISSSLYRMS